MEMFVELCSMLLNIAKRLSFSQLPGGKYEKGYNADQGDKGILWKLDRNWRRIGTMYNEREWWIPAQ